jgi:hypothetical protein
VGEQTEVLPETVFELIKHSEERVNLVGVNPSFAHCVVSFLRLRVFFLLSFLQVFFGFNRDKLVLQLILETVLDRCEACAQLI